MLKQGDRFGKYRIESVAGAGGMGVVYRATEIGLERPVALKLVAPERATDPGLSDRLVRESVAVARVDHPNVVTIYGAGEVDGSVYVAMRWIEGRDLDRLVAEDGPLALERAAGVLQQVARALDAAHASGLVHRDVKPANVLVTPWGHAYLSDFGLTKTLSASTTATYTGQLLGTIDYVAPEQIEGRDVDARADVYGLGALAYKALTGIVPFEREGSIARLWAHLNDPAPSLLDLRPDAPRALDVAVRRALAKAPEDRFATAGDFAGAVSAALGHSIVAANVAAAASETATLATAPVPRWGSPRPTPAEPPAPSADVPRWEPSRAPAEPRRSRAVRARRTPIEDLRAGAQGLRRHPWATALAALGFVLVAAMTAGDSLGEGGEPVERPLGAPPGGARVAVVSTAVARPDERKAAAKRPARRASAKHAATPPRPRVARRAALGEGEGGEGD